MTEAERLERERLLQEKIARLELDLEWEATDRRFGYAVAFCVGSVFGVILASILVALRF